MIYKKPVNYKLLIILFLVSFSIARGQDKQSPPLKTGIGYCPECNYYSQNWGSCPYDNSLLILQGVYYCPYHLSKNMKEYDGSISEKPGICLNCKRPFIKMKIPSEKEWEKYVSSNDSFEINVPGRPEISDFTIKTMNKEILFHQYLWKSNIELYDNLTYEVSVAKLPEKIPASEYQEMLEKIADEHIKSLKDELISDIYFRNENFEGREIHLNSDEGFADRKIQYFIKEQKIYKIELKAFKHKFRNKYISDFFSSFNLI